MKSQDWSSLAPQRLLAERLFGVRGDAMVNAWLDGQVERITDAAFARLFSAHIDLPDIACADYNHRLVHAGGHRLLGGIRFYGHDLARPFVEVVAHDFDDWDALAVCVSREWSAFHPLHLRVLLPHGAELPSHVFVDTSVYLARYRDMAPPDDRVSLAPFERAEDAVALVGERFRDLSGADPALARDIAPAEPRALRSLHAAGQLAAIRTAEGGRGTTVGLLAIAPGAIEWIEGDEVNEEVVTSAHNGHGYAASAQRAWAARAGIVPTRLLIGTIDRLNVASRRTARRAGRKAVLDYVFVPLPARSRDVDG